MPQSAPGSILELADLATPMAIRVAATLNVAESVGRDGKTAEMLATEAGVMAEPLRRVLDHLVLVGVFEFDADSSCYRATALGAQMREDARVGVKPLLDITSAGGRTELAFVDLPEAVTTGRPAYQVRYGLDFWSDLDANPRLRSTFDRQMNWRFGDQAQQIAMNYDWGRFPNIIDVGGGDGMLLAQILETHPHVRGSVVELPPTARAAGDRFAAAGLAARATATGGSFFDPLPSGADAYILCDILHDWDDEHCRAILDRCVAAAAPSGKVVVIEALRGFSGTTRWDLSMLISFNGKERSKDELTDIAARSGLTAQHPPVAISDRRLATEFAPTA